jgi:hypothetical protein
MTTLFRTPLRRRISRWLAGVMLLCALHPVLALGFTPARAGSDMVQICTGSGMVWVRLVDGDTSASASSSQGEPSPESGGLTAGPCPICAAFAQLAPPGDSAPRFVLQSLPTAAPADPSACPRDAARVILDAPTRGPPPPSTSA